MIWVRLWKNYHKSTGIDANDVENSKKWKALSFDFPLCITDHYFGQFFILFFVSRENLHAINYRRILLVDENEIDNIIIAMQRRPHIFYNVELCEEYYLWLLRLSKAVEENTIFAIFDTPHLLKSVRNNLIGNIFLKRW